MSSDAMELVDTTCVVCGKEVRGEKVLWKDHTEGRLEQDQSDRLTRANRHNSGGYVCGTCGTVLCRKEHKKDVENVTFMRGYWFSPCPQCGDLLHGGFLLAEPPEGSFAASDSSTPQPPGGSPAEAQSAPQAIGSIQWQTGSVKDGAVAFACPHCEEEHTFAAELFQNPPADGIEGFTRTTYTLKKQGLAALLSFATAVALFVWVANAFSGGILVAAFVTVFAYAAVIRPLFQPVFAAMPFIAREPIPVYAYTCTGCSGETHVATDGSRLELPVQN